MFIPTATGGPANQDGQPRDFSELSHSHQELSLDTEETPSVELLFRFIVFLYLCNKNVGDTLLGICTQCNDASRLCLHMLMSQHVNSYNSQQHKSFSPRDLCTLHLNPLLLLFPTHFCV